jgi:hypothetical protein
VSFDGIAMGLYGTIFRAAEGLPVLPLTNRRTAMLTAPAQQYGITENKRGWARIPQKWYRPCDQNTRKMLWRAPLADKSNDPVAMWQNMIGEMEKGFNSFANQAMASPEFSKVVNQVGGVTAGAQKQLSDLMEKYLVGMNLPSRAQMVSMGERLQSIEGQLNEIKALLHQVHNNSSAPDGGYAGAPRPPRTRRPPAAGGEQK